MTRTESMYPNPSYLHVPGIQHNTTFKLYVLLLPNQQKSFSLTQLLAIKTSVIAALALQLYLRKTLKNTS